MARLFANSNEEDQVQDLNNVESAVAVDGPEDVKDDLQDPVEETALESYKDIKEAVEEALETQDEIQEQIENSEQVLESNPEGVTEEVIQDAQECLVASLSKLGLSRDQISKYRVSSESCKSNAERLQATVKKLRLAQETIRRSLKGAIVESYKVTDRKFGISQEYNAVDIPQIIPLFNYANDIWRKLTNKSKTSINNPGAMVPLLLGNWSSVGQAAQILSKFLIIPPAAAGMAAAGTVTVAAGLIAGALVGQAHDMATGKNPGLPGSIKLNKKYQELHKGANINKVNIYKDLIMDYKKVKADNIEILKQEFEAFKVCIRNFKVVFNTPCEMRPMGINEINQMKLFKPDKAKAEMAVAVDNLKKISPELGKLGEEVVAFVTKEIIDFIARHTIVD